MRIFPATVFLLIAGGAALPALASACDLQRQATVSVALSGALQKDPLSASIGETLYVKRASLSTLAHRKQDILCTPVQSQEQLILKGNMTGTMTGDHVYPTSVPGIGVRLSVVVGQKGNHTSLLTLPVSEQIALNSATDITSDNVFVKTELVKTGPIATLGNISYQTPSLLSFSRSATQQIVNVDYSLAVTPPAGYCRFTSTHAAFSLAAVDSSAVTSSSVLPATPLPINFACVGAPAHIEMTLYGAADAVANGVLRNKEGAEQATGVGVQLLYRNAPVAFGSPISLDDVPLLNNQGDIPLSARYVATSGKVTAGKVETLATIKLNFL
ncbi:fimbrial protein [Lelliottia sp. V106_10]|uniref:fimbrial protein n=1 Tax=Lelliottia wanjuensis TaxID=3050585 RepID=UPI00254FC526|nr:MULTISPECIES: fimbrial protein [unclassified Lelliottia]MDK9357319.1 fimbrial protein [Lelliottia sp. V106_16]MDK9373188.1 fimbrial protein [Lelliottia sp. V106_10]MDK9599992.1 fimbrial protein [Lelliottia sp. V106_5]